MQDTKLAVRLRNLRADFAQPPTATALCPKKMGQIGGVCAPLSGGCARPV